METAQAAQRTAGQPNSNGRWPLGARKAETGAIGQFGLSPSAIQLTRAGAKTEV
jgi:hypothetical protein